MIAPDAFPAVRAWLACLTPAERFVAVHLAQGLSNKEISTLLGKAEPTIKHQISAVLEKTGVPSRGRFIALYHQQAVLAPAVAGNR